VNHVDPGHHLEQLAGVVVGDEPHVRSALGYATDQLPKFESYAAFETAAFFGRSPKPQLSRFMESVV
jgi:hypothetical protein